jgi:hypothetical protein
MARMSHDVHLGAQQSCHSCHGGNPDSALAADAAAAMDPNYAPNPFRGVPARVDQPAFCGRCHSDVTFMRRYVASPRVDQQAEYWTSRHGQQLQEGDPRVAVCTSCHGSHGIRGAGDPESPVYASNVAATCARCHSDAQRMAGYTVAGGAPLPTNQFAAWRRSVHAAALLEKGDLSAPTCNDCHGNHGAVPPGLESIGFVCGYCHGREADLFRESPKQSGFARHNDYLAGAGPEGCRACHTAAELQSPPGGLHTFSQCATCHEHHAVVRPTIGLLGPLPETPCAFCHESPPDSAARMLEPQSIQARYREVRDRLLAESAGLGREERFNWLVAQARELDAHTLPAEEGQRPLRPQFARLFAKLRIGPTAYTYTDPDSSRPVRVALRRCPDCHTAQPDLAAEATGFETARAFVDGMWALGAGIGTAERTLVTAQRGGVAVQGGLLELDHALDSQIELEVLVHSFSSAAGGGFVTKQAAGLDHARAALAEGRAALEDLSHRRWGLGIALAIILVALIALGARIARSSHATGG